MSHHIMAENLDMELLPCIIDSTGLMHEHFKAFLKKVLAVAAEQKHIPLSVIWNYWCSAIVCALFKGNANSVASLSRWLHGVSYPDSYESADLTVSRSSYINCI